MTYPFARWLFKPLVRRRITNVTGTDHLPRSLPYIVVANHSSWLDSAYLVAVLSSFTDKKIYLIASTKKYRWLGAVPIDPQNPSSVLDVCAAKLAASHPVIIFPEGNSNPERLLRPGKTGAARLAQRSHAPVVPIGIRGTHQPGIIASILHFMCWWRPITIVVGAPFDQSWYMRTVPEFTHAIMKTISNLSGKPLRNA